MNQTVYNIKTTIQRESPAILTGLAVTGVFTTAILSVKATPKALRLLELERIKKGMDYYEDLDTLDIMKVTWKEYIPALLSGILTISCIIGANSIHVKRTAAIASVYSVATEALKEYQDKVIETIGEKKEEKLRNAIDQDHLTKNPVESNEIILLKGDTLFYDKLSGRYFKSDMETVRQQVNNFNQELLQEMYKPLNEFYELIGLDNTDMGRNMGWNVDDGQLSIRYSAMIATNSEPCIVLNYNIEPRFL